MHRFFVTGPWKTGDEVVLADDQAHQISQVLRLRPQTLITLLDNNGWAYTVVLTEVNKRVVRGRVTDRTPASGEPATYLTLYVGLLKADKFEWVLQKGTEIGVSCFVPLLTERSVVQTVSPTKQARWERILTEAAEQSGRGRIPQLRAPVPFSAALSALPPDTLALIPYEQEKTTTLRRVALSPPRPLALFIGPEGGWSEHEIALAQQHDAIPITLGPRILRAETAAVVAAALVLYELGEMSNEGS